MFGIEQDAKASSPSIKVWLQSMPWFRPESRRRVIPVLGSLLVHALILLLLGLWIIPALTTGSDKPIIEASLTPAASDTHPPLQTTPFAVTPNSPAALTAVSAATLHQPAAATAVTTTNVRTPRPPTVLAPAVLDLNHMSDEALLAEVPIIMSALPMHRHRGETRVAEVQSTGDLAATLHGDLQSIAADGDAIIVWMLDQSLSMQLDIKVLAEQLLGTLSAIEEDKSSLVMHYVVAFGDDVTVVLQSTPRARAVATAIYHLPQDPSGVENTFQAVNWCVDNLFNAPKWRLRKERQKLLVVWTDESGDDYLHLENTIQNCLRSHVRVDVIGPSAVLGAQTGYTAFRHPADNRVYQLPVHRGPDSSFPQKLSLGYWHRGVPASYDEAFRGPWPGSGGSFGGSNLDSLLCGFSPYALTRLARQTGGRFTIFDRPADRSPFPLEQVRDYLPDYRSLAEIGWDLRRQPLRQIVLASAAETWKSRLTRYSQPRIDYRARTAGQHPQQFRRSTLPEQLGKAIHRASATAVEVEKALAVFAMASASPAFRPQTEYAVRSDSAATPRQRDDRNSSRTKPDDATDKPTDNPLASLPDPELVDSVDVNETLLEQLYRQEPSKRWRAWNDLNLGRLLAVSVRLREYLLTAHALAQNIDGLNADTNHVRLTASRNLRGGPASETRAAIAQRLLQRCIEENPQTPWSVMAKQELQSGLGVELQQRYLPLPPPKLSVPSVRPSRPKLPNL